MSEFRWLKIAAVAVAGYLGGEAVSRLAAVTRVAEAVPYGGASERCNETLARTMATVEPAHGGLQAIGTRSAASAAPAAGGYLGVLLAGEAVEITSRVEARVRSVEVQLGDAVRTGEVVARLDGAELERELAIVTAQHAAAAAEAERSGIEVREATRIRDNRRELWRESLIEREAFDAADHGMRHSQRSLRVAMARAAETKARSAAVTQRLDDTLLRAPFAGIVAQRWVDPGATVGPDRPILRLVSTSSAHVRFAVPETAAEDVSPRLAVWVSVPGTDRHFGATVSRVAPELDVSSRMLFVEAEVAPEVAVAPWLGPLRGRTVRVSLTGSPR